MTTKDEPRTLAEHAAELRRALLSPALKHPPTHEREVQAKLARMCLALAERVAALEIGCCCPTMNEGATRIPAKRCPVPGHGDAPDAIGPPPLVLRTAAEWSEAMGTPPPESFSDKPVEAYRIPDQDAVDDAGRWTRDVEKGEVVGIPLTALPIIEANTKIEERAQTIHALRSKLAKVEEAFEVERRLRNEDGKASHLANERAEGAEELSEKRRALVDEFSGKLVRAREERDESDELLRRYHRATRKAWDRLGLQPAPGYENTTQVERLELMLGKLVEEHEELRGSHERTPSMVATGNPLKLAVDAVRTLDPHAEAIIEDRANLSAGYREALGLVLDAHRTLTCSCRIEQGAVIQVDHDCPIHGDSAKAQVMREAHGLAMFPIVVEPSSCVPGATVEISLSGTKAGR